MCWQYNPYEVDSILMDFAYRTAHLLFVKRYTPLSQSIRD
jgi:hypothetical protein